LASIYLLETKLKVIIYSLARTRLHAKVTFTPFVSIIY